MEFPEVQFTQRDGRALAYQLFGSPGLDFLVISEWAANSDSLWEHPGHLRMWRYHGSLGRVARFDRSGVGASDPPVGDIEDVHEWAADGFAVLDAIGSTRTVVAGEAWGGHAAIVMAATFPERVERLVLVNSYARMLRDDDYPIGIDPAAVSASTEFVRTNWGMGRVIAQSVPSLAANYFDYCGRYERTSVSPLEASRMVGAAFRSDVRHLLERIECPTFVLFTGDNGYVDLRHSQYLAEHIRDAELDTTRGDSYYQLGSGFGAKYLEFVSGATEPRWSDRQLAVVAFSDIVGSTAQLAVRGDREWRTILDSCNDAVDGEARRAGGRVVKQTGDGHVMTFTSPGSAISALLRIRRAAEVLGVSLRFGMHMGEIETRDDTDIAGIAVHTAARIMGQASGGEILVSRVIHELVAGAGIDFDDRGTLDLKGLPSGVQVFAVRA